MAIKYLNTYAFKVESQFDAFNFQNKCRNAKVNLDSYKWLPPKPGENGHSFEFKTSAPIERVRQIIGRVDNNDMMFDTLELIKAIPEMKIYSLVVDSSQQMKHFEDRLIWHNMHTKLNATPIPGKTSL